MFCNIVKFRVSHDKILHVLRVDHWTWRINDNHLHTSILLTTTSVIIKYKMRFKHEVSNPCRVISSRALFGTCTVIIVMNNVEMVGF